MLPWTLSLAAAAQALVPGDRLDVAALVDGSGAPVVVAADRPIVVNLWASWCGPCRAELPLLDALNDRVGKDGVRVIAVAEDTVRKRASSLADHLGLRLTVVYDVTNATARALNPPTLPTTYVVDGTGVVRYVHAGALDAAGIAQIEAEIGYLTGP